MKDTKKKDVKNFNKNKIVLENFNFNLFLISNLVLLMMIGRLGNYNIL